MSTAVGGLHLSVSIPLLIHYLSNLLLYRVYVLYMTFAFGLYIDVLGGRYIALKV